MQFILVLKSLGIKQGDEILVPCMSWYSSFTAIVMAGGIPIGIDINDNLLMNLDNIKKKILQKKLKQYYMYILQDLHRI